jgi:hypothetical protein
MDGCPWLASLAVLGGRKALPWPWPNMQLQFVHPPMMTGGALSCCAARTLCVLTGIFNPKERRVEEFRHCFWLAERSVPGALVLSFIYESTFQQMFTKQCLCNRPRAAVCRGSGLRFRGKSATLGDLCFLCTCVHTVTSAQGAWGSANASKSA